MVDTSTVFNQSFKFLKKWRFTALKTTAGFTYIAQKTDIAMVMDILKPGLSASLTFP